MKNGPGPKLKKGIQKMEKRKKLNKFKISIVVILILLSFAITVFGRYIYNSVREAYFTARQFYFSSDILTVNGSNYQYDNWGGTGTYAIEFELYSYLNSISKLDYDLGYTVTCSTSDTDKIRIGINSDDIDAPTTTTGTISYSTNISKVGIFVTPISEIEKNDSVTINVTASTSVPYQKTISCEFTLKAVTQGENTYLIEDVVNRDYAILSLTCVNESGAQVTLEFDPSKLRIDMNDEVYINRIVDEDVTIDIDGKTYVKKIVFNIDAETTKNVKFYKVNKAQNYTYPGVQATSPITVTI